MRYPISPSTKANSMKLQHLKYLVAVLHEGSLSRAARSLHMSQPTLSQHIQALEHSVGVQLLNRTPSGVSATAAGKILAEHAIQILESLERARQDAVSTAADVRGEVSIVMPRMVSARLSPDLIKLAVRDFPKVKLSIREGNSLFCTELVENARVDLGILPAGYNQSKTKSLPLLKEKLFLVGSVHNTLGVPASNAPITFAEAAAYPLTLIKKPHSLRTEIEKLASLQDVALNVIFESDSGAINRYYVSAGVAFSVSVR